MWKIGRFYLVYLFLGLYLMAGCATNAPPTPTTTAVPSPTATPEWHREGWELVWQDEFEGETINPENWTFDIGGNGWGNQEWEYYTNRPENARIENGRLIIEARQESYAHRDYTSARLKTQRLQSWLFGRVEARIQVPAGQGIWPAFWMLGSQGGGWPKIGEIDIMEHIGSEPNTVYGTVHGPGYAGSEGVGSSHTLPNELADEFHIFAVEWQPELIRWYLDGTLYFTLTPDDVPGDWVYDDHPFFLILNVAVGGTWPGYPDETTTFPQRMLVDYVRVYQATDLAE